MADVAVNPESTNPSELLGQGIKAYVLQDYEASVAALSRATELLVQEHNGNDLHDSLGEVYLYYGKALLGLSREQNEALGDAVPKDQDDESDEDDEGIETEEGEAENTENQKNEENAKSETAEKSLNAIDETSEEKNGKAESSEKKKEVEKNGEAKANGETAAANGEAGPSSSNADEPDSTEDASQDDEPTDLQVAWEVLELAKKIYQRQGDDAKKHLADTLIVLGEVSLESENFDSAVNDIKEGIEIQKSLFSNDSRTVAETYYKLGVAYSTDSQITEAIDSFGHSLQYLRNRIEALEKLDPPTEKSKEEINEIQGLIPDIEEKIADMKSSKEEAIKKITEAIKVPRIDDGAGASSSSSSKQATNISHLVKRKRKPDENDGKEEVQPAKKSATENQ